MEITIRTSSQIQTGVILLSTGFRQAVSPYPEIYVVQHDFRPYATDKPTPWGPPLRPDGTDSLPNGMGTGLSLLGAQFIKMTKNPSLFQIFCTKIGDSGDPLKGIDVFAIIPALRWAVSLSQTYPKQWRWVAVLDWDMTAIGQETEGNDLMQQMINYNIPLVVPAGNYGLNVDGLEAGGNPVPGNYLANILCVANTDPAGNLRNKSDFGKREVHVGVPADSTSQAAIIAGCWVAASWETNLGGTSIDIINRVKTMASPVAPLSGKVSTGGLLVGAPH